MVNGFFNDADARAHYCVRALPGISSWIKRSKMDKGDHRAPPHYFGSVLWVISRTVLVRGSLSAGNSEPVGSPRAYRLCEKRRGPQKIGKRTGIPKTVAHKTRFGVDVEEVGQYPSVIISSRRTTHERLPECQPSVSGGQRV